MAKFFDPTYNPLKDSGSSGVEVSDLRPEQDRDVDLRRLDPEERDIFSDVTRDFAYTPGKTGYKQVNNSQEDGQARVSKFMKAAKTAGAYKQRAGIAEFTRNSSTPRSPGNMGGTETPSMGDTVGTTGSTNYARKPQPNFGKRFV